VHGDRLPGAFAGFLGEQILQHRGSARGLRLLFCQYAAQHPVSVLGGAVECRPHCLD
jgi:hypothetical protein